MIQHALTMYWINLDERFIGCVGPSTKVSIAQDHRVPSGRWGDLVSVSEVGGNFAPFILHDSQARYARIHPHQDRDYDRAKELVSGAKARAIPNSVMAAFNGELGITIATNRGSASW